MLFSWYAADYCTDAHAASLLPEEKANPSRHSWADVDYLEQQRSRLPSHKYRRLHLNLPGLPEGSAYSFEKIDDAIERGVLVRSPMADKNYYAFVDMSGGSNDDATLSIAHREGYGDESRAIVDVVMNQRQPPPFDPRTAVDRFVKVLKEYRCFYVVGDRYGGETFVSDFARHEIGYQISDLTVSELYEALEPRLNAGKIVLLDSSILESQLLGLVWRGGKITHPSAEHDDWSNSVAGAIHLASSQLIDTEHMIAVESERFRVLVGHGVNLQL